MLEQLLKYHQNLLPSEFVEGVLSRIKKSYQTRMLILGVFAILGMAIVVLTLNSVFQVGWFSLIASYFDNTQYLIYSALVLLILFMAGSQWLFKDSVFS